MKGVVLLFLLIGSAFAHQQEASALLLDPSGTQFVAGSGVSSLKAEHVADVSLRALGVGSIDHQFSAPFLTNNIFSRANAAVTVAVAGVDAATVRRHSLSSLAALESTGKQVHIETSSPVCFGGLVSRVFKGVSKANVAELVADATHGQGITFSLASCGMMAGRISAASYGNNACFRLDAQARGFRACEGVFQSELIQSLQAAIGSIKLDKSPVAVQLTEQAAIVRVGDSDVSLPLSSENVVRLLAEVSAALELPAALAASPLAADAIPDVYSLAFASVQAIGREFGLESLEQAAALRLIDGAVGKLVAGLSEVYGNRVVVSIVMGGSQFVEEQVEVELQQIAAFPVLAQSAQVFAVGASSNSTVSAVEIGRYQLGMWVAIALISIVLFALYTIFGMEVARDKLLYSKLALNVDRRARH